MAHHLSLHISTFLSLLVLIQLFQLFLSLLLFFQSIHLFIFLCELFLFIFSYNRSNDFAYCHYLTYSLYNSFHFTLSYLLLPLIQFRLHHSSMPNMSQLYSMFVVLFLLDPDSSHCWHFYFCSFCFPCYVFRQCSPSNDLCSQ